MLYLFIRYEGPKFLEDNMKQVIIFVERVSDGTYSAYSQKVDGIWGMGDTAEQAKQSALESLRLFKENNPTRKWPKLLKGEYELIFSYKLISKSDI